MRIRTVFQHQRYMFLLRNLYGLLDIFHNQGDMLLCAIGRRPVIREAEWKDAYPWTVQLFSDAACAFQIAKMCTDIPFNRIKCRIKQTYFIVLHQRTQKKYGTCNTGNLQIIGIQQGANGVDFLQAAFFNTFSKHIMQLYVRITIKLGYA